MIVSDGAVRQRLEAFCRNEFDASELTISRLERIPEGHSGFTYFVDFVDGPHARLVLRLPPPGARPQGPADVARQGRIMTALHHRGLPVPEVHVISEDPGALDGRPFILMEAIDGVRADKAAAEADNAELARAAVAVMREIHAVDPADTGIGAEPARSLADELDRWSALIAKAPDELTKRAADLRALLSRSLPADHGPARLVHGDFTYGNLLFRGGTVAAVLDWEIAQLGNPLLDLGSLCVIAKRHDYPNDPNPSGAIRATVEWLIDAYGAAGPVEWTVALSYYKYAAIVGYNTMLHRRGKRPDPIYDLMGDTVIGLIDGAIEILT
ncbi:aminoglycoside phosphotransferase [Mycolicibacterium rhodesiae JS60]|nr:aminoglycoside phosphotransferase [Mycolicibacterium rhodesiae JS60]